MSHLTKLAIAIVLGLVAAIANANWLAAKKQVPLYVGFSHNVDVSQVITKDALTPIPIPGEPAIAKTFVRWSDRQKLLKDETAIRNYRAGDLFPLQDIQFSKQEETWEFLGPFRVVGINSNSVTIAVNSEFDEKTELLFKLIKSRTTLSQSIVAIQAMPNTPDESTVDPKEKIVLQTIPLNGVTYAPDAFQTGTAIRFVLSSFNRY